MGTQTPQYRDENILKNMSVQVKAILHRGPNEEELPRKEIRRFEVDANVSGSYDFLRAKIIALYPDLTEDSAFRLMWTDDEGDNVCFSTDEEYAQALKFVNSQENKLFKVMVKMPATMGPQKKTNENQFQEGINTFAHHAAQFGDALNSAFGGRDPQKMAKKCEKMKAKQQFHESKAKQLNEMLRSINPQMHHHIHSVAQQMAQMNQGDSVDIPINHSSSSSSTTTTSTTNPTGTTTTTTNVYPELNKTGDQQMEEDFTPVSTEDANQAKLTEAVKKMAELGFEGEWVEPLLKSVDCDIARAVDKLTPVVKK